MYLIGDEYATLAELLGGNDDVSYLDFQTAMLKWDRERRLYGVTRDEALADSTSSRTNVPARHVARNINNAAQQNFTGWGLCSYTTTIMEGNWFQTS